MHRELCQQYMSYLPEGGWAALNPAVDENGVGLGVYLHRTANPSWILREGDLWVGWGGLRAAGTGDSGHGHAKLGKEAKEGFWAPGLTCTRNASQCFLKDWVGGLSKTASLAEDRGRDRTEEEAHACATAC